METNGQSLKTNYRQQKRVTPSSSSSLDFSDLGGTRVATTPDPEEEKGIDFSDLGATRVSPTPSPSATPSMTPETDREMSQTGEVWKKIMAAAKAPSPAWMQPAENVIRSIADWKGLVEPVTKANPLYWMGQYNRMIGRHLPGAAGGISEATGRAQIGLARGIGSMATPMNIGLAVASPPTAAGRTALAALFTAQGVANTPAMLEQIKKDYEAKDAGAITEHVSQLAASYLPAAHFAGRIKGKAAKAEELPEPPLAPAGTVEQPGQRGFTTNIPEGFTQAQNEALMVELNLLQRGDITETEYRTRARKILGMEEPVSAEPVVEHEGSNYTFDPEATQWSRIDEDGTRTPLDLDADNPADVKLAESLTRKRRTEQETAREAEKPEVETDEQAEARARKLAKVYQEYYGGEPDAVFRDMTDKAGVEPTWVEFADELQSEITKLTPDIPSSLKALTEGIAKRRGVSVEKIEEEQREREFQAQIQTLNEARDTELSRKELAEEAKQKKGGKYAKQGGHAQVPSREVTLGVKPGAGGTEPAAGGRHHVGRAQEGEGARGTVPAREEAGPIGRATKETPPPEIDLELYNRAKHRVARQLQLPENAVELVKLQEEGIAPDASEIHRLTILEYEKLLKEKADKAAPQKPKERERSHMPIQEITATQALGSESGKPGLRETILNARSMGLTREEYQTWRRGEGPDYDTDAESIAKRKAERGIKEEAPGEVERPVEHGEFKEEGYTAEPTEKSKTFRTKTPVDEFAASPETPVATAISEQGGMLSKTGAQKAGKYEGNEDLWEDGINLSHKSHNKIYKPNGEMPDVTAQNLYDAGLIDEPSIQALKRALEQESATIRGKAKNKPEAGLEGKIKQAENFGKGQLEEVQSGTKSIPAKELDVGDTVDVDGTKLKVTEIDKDGNVTLEDGRRFGIQEVANDEIIYGEIKGEKGKTEAPKEEPESAEIAERRKRQKEQGFAGQGGGRPKPRETGEGGAGAAPAPVPTKPKPGGGAGGAVAAEPEKFSTKTNFKKVGDSRYEHKNTKLIINKGKEGGWDARHPTTGETIGNYPSRQAAMESHADGGTVPIAKQGKILKAVLEARGKGKEGGFALNEPIGKDILEFGQRLLSKGMDYGRWAKDMVKHLGRKITSRLKEIWENLTGGKFREGFKEGGGMRSGEPLGLRKKTGEKPAETSPPEEAPLAQGEILGLKKAGDAWRVANEREQENPRYPDKVVKDLLDNKKVALDSADQASLVKHRGKLQQARDLAAAKAKNPQLSEGDRAEAIANFEDLDSQIRTLDQATREGLVIKGKTQKNMWHVFRAKDYSADSVKDKLLMAQNGAALSKEQISLVDKAAGKLSRLMTDIESKKRMTGWVPGAGKPPPAGLRHMEFEAFKTKLAMDKMVFRAKLKQKPLPTQIWAVAHEVLSIPRAFMASMDLSAVRRQGGILFLSHPIRSLRAMPDMLRAMKSEEAYFSLMQEIRERANAELYKSSKLGLTDINTPRLQDMEEQYMSQWAEYVPGVAHSQRAYVYFLNRLRADTFDAMAKTLSRKGAVTDKQAAVISNFINVFTGRGTNSGRHADALIALNDFMFAPRYMLSRFQAITGQPIRFALKNKEARALIASEYARALIGYGIVYGTVATALKEFAEVSLDWRSTDFGKIKIGNTRIDIMSGLSQPTVLIGRLVTRHTKQQSGKVEPLFAGGGARSRKLIGSVLEDFARSKLAPIPAAIWNSLEEKKVTGEPTSLGQETVNLMIPLSGQDIYKALREYGVPKGAALGMIAIFGDSVNTYSPRASARRRKRHRGR